MASWSVATLTFFAAIASGQDDEWQITIVDGITAEYTVWTTSVTADSHVAFAGGIDLDIQGSPTYDIGADAARLPEVLRQGGQPYQGDTA